MATKKAIINNAGTKKEVVSPNLVGVGSGINIEATAGDISSPNNGDIWYNSSTGKFRKYENGVASNLDTGGGTFDYGTSLLIASGQLLM